MEDLFSFEKLDIYRRALLFVQKVQDITNSEKRNYSWIDQFNRAAMSIVLNISEGAGRRHEKDKKNFYFIARGSAFECIPLIDLGNSLKIIDTYKRNELREDLRAICKMLTKLIQSVGKEALSKNE